MPETFKKNLEGKDYAFYRTSILNDTIYFVLFDNDDKRDSVRIAKVNGHWKLPPNAPVHIYHISHQLIKVIEENEAI